MQRTESKVVTVMPYQENTRISEMEMFGWNLQGRQDVVTPVHADSDATPKLLGNGYNIDTSIESAHYVKLHFVRPLDLPNLGQIRKLESEYPFRELPEESKSTWPWWVIVVGIASFAIVQGVEKSVEGFIFATIVGLVFIGIAIVGLYANGKDNEKKRKIRQEILEKRQEVIEQLKSLSKEN